MDADEVEMALENKFAAKDAVPVESPVKDELLPPVSVERFCVPQQVSHVPLPSCSNHFSVLKIHEDFEPERNDEDTRNPLSAAQPPAEAQKLCQLKWEKQLGLKLVIQSLEEGPNCIMLLIHLKTMDTMEEAATEAKGWWRGLGRG
jgi:hypothetical protein